MSVDKIAAFKEKYEAKIAKMAAKHAKEIEATKAKEAKKLAKSMKAHGKVADTLTQINDVLQANDFANAHKPAGKAMKLASAAMAISIEFAETDEDEA